jgi:hypothetical protein
MLYLREQGVFQNRGSTDDLANGGDVAGHEVDRVGPADDPPTASVLESLVTAQGLHRAP